MTGYRIHTGQFDDDGEICMIAIGCTLEVAPDGVNIIKGPKGDVIFTTKNKVSKISQKEIAQSIMNEAKLKRTSER